jgi:hypothetical protein
VLAYLSLWAVVALLGLGLARGGTWPLRPIAAPRGTVGD